MMPPTTKPSSKLLPIQKLPTDLLASEVLSKYLKYSVGKNASKIFRTTRGHGRGTPGSGGGGVTETPLEKQFQKAVSHLNEQECLEAIYSKYPFLPNQEEVGTQYIFIQKQPFQNLTEIVSR